MISNRPWTVYAPALVFIVAMIALPIARRPWPASAPVHFNFHWQADRWGSPQQALIFIPLVVLITFAAIFVAISWSRFEEGRKRLNLTVPVMALPLGAVAGVHLWYWWNLNLLSQTGTAPHPWWWVAMTAGVNLIACSLMERLRIAR